MGVDESNADGGTEQQQDPAKLAEQIANLNKALQEARTKASTASERLAAYEAEKAAAEAARLAEQGEYKTLAEQAQAERDALKQRLTSYEEREAQRLAGVVSEVEGITANWPDEDKALIPQGISPDEQLALARRLAAKLHAQAQHVATGTRSGGAAGKPVIPAECAADAAKYGKSPEQWYPIWLKLPAGKAWQEKQSKT